jgi:hypothetical protein
VGGVELAPEIGFGAAAVGLDRGQGDSEGAGGQVGRREEGGAGGDMAEGGGEAARQGGEVIEGQDAVVEGQGEELTLGGGERGERGSGEVDEGTEEAGGGGRVGGAREEQDAPAAPETNIGEGGRWGRSGGRGLRWPGGRGGGR